MNQTSEGEYRFAHYTIQEFLTAKGLVEQRKVDLLKDFRITNFLAQMLLQAIGMLKEDQREEKHVSLKSFELKKLQITNALLLNICLDECDLSGAIFRKSKFENCSFKESNLTGASFSGSTFNNVTFGGARLEGANFEDIKTGSGRGLYIGRQGQLLVRIPGGRFQMGSPKNERGRFSSESPIHSVKVSDFYLGQYPVSNEEYGVYLDANPKATKPEYWSDSRYNSPELPVVGIGWEEAKEYCEWAGLRLPSEAEWEFACRAGTATRFYCGDDESELDRVCWYAINSGGQTHPVGKKTPNGFDLYDMHGNIWEWVEDDWHNDYKGAPADGRPWVNNPRAEFRVYRGGSWCNGAVGCRSACRYYWHPGLRGSNLGFRVARSIP